MDFGENGRDMTRSGIGLDGGRWARQTYTFIAAIVLGSVLLFAPGSAGADTSLCPPGSGAGQCQNPQGVAVNEETGAIYVADRGNNRIDVFADTGSFVMAFGWGVDSGVAAFEKCTTASGCQPGIAGSGTGQFSAPSSIAVDNTGGAGQGDVYVGTAYYRVQKVAADGSFILALGVGVNSGTSGNPDICTNAGPPTDICGAGSEGTGAGQFSGERDPLSVGPTGALFVADSAPISPGNLSDRIENFAPTGALLESVELFTGDLALRSLAVDSSEDVYVTVEGAGGQIRKYDLSGPARLCEAQLDPGTETTALAIDAGDDLYAAQRQVRDKALGSYQVVTEYSSTCGKVRRFGYDRIPSSPAGVAAHTSPAGNLLVSQASGVNYLLFPPPGPVIPPSSVELAKVGNTKATLKAEINPEGKATSYRFDYVDQQSFEEGGVGFASPDTKSSPVTPVGAEDFNLHTVEAQVGCTNPVVESSEGKCLAPETSYRFRVVATNADGAGEGEVEGPSFLTKAALEIRATFTTEVGPDSARLNATVDPLGIPSVGFFEYVDDETFEASGFSSATRVPALGELDFGLGSAATRGATLSDLQPGTTYHYRVVADDQLIEPVAGPAETFTTFARNEAVSCPENETFRSGPSGLLPDCRAYELVSPLEKESGDVIPLNEATTSLLGALEQSSTSGAKLAYGSYRAFGDAPSAPLNSQYIASRNSASGWASHAITPPRTRLDLEAINTLDTEVKALSPDLCESWFRTVAEPSLAADAVAGFPNIYRRSDGECGSMEYEAITTVVPPHRLVKDYNQLELQGVSTDGSAVLYVAPDNLTPEAVQLPGKPPPAGSSGELQQLYERRGAQLYFICLLPGNIPSNEPCQAGGPANVLSSGSLTRFASLNNAISEDGSHVFWTSYHDVPGPGPIYVRIDNAQTIAVSEEAEQDQGSSTSQYWMAAEDGSKAIFTTGGNLYEFEVATETTTLIAEDSAGVLGASDDAEWVYFASENALTGANAEGRLPIVGEANLYLRREGTTQFIATLRDADFISQFSPITPIPVSRTSRVTPNGHQAAFMTAANPTGYDNTDARSGKADAEVYRYDATANEGGGELLCVSCNPTGARPAGTDINAGKATEIWAAGSIPGWENTLYASRALSEDGRRVFFESTDALSPLDSNGVGDVYQWEGVGTGNCTQASSSYSAANGGCVDLISSGQSARLSRFVDASPSGEDVFFSTLASLLPEDYGLVDIYDARVDGGLPSPPLPAPECEAEACQNPAPAPLLQTPSSLTYSGPGNVQEPAAKPKKCPKGKVKKNGHCVKKKAAKKGKGKKQRGAGR
jgi:hypothetical protein